MPPAGEQAPSFQLNSLDGAAHALAHLLADGPLALAFFKVSCPTCKLTFPFLQRAAVAGLRIFGISQDPASHTAAFRERLGLSFPLLLDLEEAAYPVSSAYSISSVPTIFVLGTDGRIEQRIEGFEKAALVALGVHFHVHERVPEFQPG